MKNYFGFMLLLSVMLLMSCGGNDLASCTAQSFNERVNETIQELNSKIQTYAQDPTPEKCNDYKEAANKYLDAVEGFRGCAGISQTDYELALSNARDAVSGIMCN